MRAFGCSRRARRIAWRAWRSASAVTAQVLTITASRSPASAVSRRMTSLSKALRRQPKVTISTGVIGLPGEKRGIECALEGKRGRPGHDDMAVLAPVDVEGPAIEHDAGPAAGQAAARCRDERRAGAGAAGAGDAGAAFPDAQADPGAIEDRCDTDIGALGKQLVVLE